jgi:hypothetical protein
VAVAGRAVRTLERASWSARRRRGLSRVIVDGDRPFDAHARCARPGSAGGGAEQCAVIGVVAGGATSVVASGGVVEATTGFGGSPLRAGFRLAVVSALAAPPVSAAASAIERRQRHR